MTVESFRITRDQDNFWHLNVYQGDRPVISPTYSVSIEDIFDWIRNNLAQREAERNKMIFYDAAKNSLDVEQYLCETLKEYAKDVKRLKDSPYVDKDDNIYQITITVEQIEPKL